MLSPFVVLHLEPELAQGKQVPHLPVNFSPNPSSSLLIQELLSVRYQLRTTPPLKLRSAPSCSAAVDTRTASGASRASVERAPSKEIKYLTF